MLVLSLLFVPVALVPLLTDVTPAMARTLEAVSWLIWTAFVFEYVTLLYLAPDRGRMIRTHVPDLLIIVLPFLRPLRALRGLRLIRVAMGLVGLSRGFLAGRRILSRPGFRGFLVLVLVVMLMGAALVYGFERGHPEANITTPADALWWALVTATTVGYGDRYPLTAEGRAVAGVLMLLGISLLSVVTANIAAFFVERSTGEVEADIEQRLERIERLLEELHDRP